MADFYQTGGVTTLQRLGRPNLDWLERELRFHAQNRPIALVLPCLYSDLEGQALTAIVDHLRQVEYLNEIVIAMGRASALGFRGAREYFKVLPQEVRLIWTDGPRIQEILQLLVRQGLDIGLPGKGQSCWIAFGDVLARHRSKIIAVHDGDIMSYDRQHLVRLCYPLAHPRMSYEFCKGYDAQGTDRLHERVTRLFMSPMIWALERVLGPHSLLLFLHGFRYPLAGETAMVTDLAWTNRIPGDRGLEIGILAEVYRNCALGRVCQADLANGYGHARPGLSADSRNAELLKMSMDITWSLFGNLASEGAIFTDGVMKTLRATYLQIARDAIRQYEDEAAINSLQYDRQEERSAVEVFLAAIERVGEDFLKDSFAAPLMSSWSEVTAAVPDIFDRLLNAVEADQRYDPQGKITSPAHRSAA